MSGTPPLRLELAPSRAFAALILVAHAAAAASLAAVLPAIPGTLLAVLVLALGVAVAWDRALLRAASSPRAIEISGPDSVGLLLTDGRRVEAAVGGRRGVNRYWVSLPVGTPTRRTLLVTSEMLGSGQFRALRLWALWGRTPGVASGQLPA